MNPNGTINKDKARLFAKGYKQKEGAILGNYSSIKVETVRLYDSFATQK